MKSRRVKHAKSREPAASPHRGSKQSDAAAPADDAHHACRGGMRIALRSSMSSWCSIWVAWVALLFGCSATVPPARTTWTAPTYRARPGVIESVDEIKEHVASNAGGDVLTGVFIGSFLFSTLLFHHGPRFVVGADTGRSALAGSDGESTTLPRYQVLVRFDDGSSMTLVYTNDVPFRRGERVVLTQHGLLGT